MTQEKIYTLKVAFMVMFEVTNPFTGKLIKIRRFYVLSDAVKRKLNSTISWTQPYQQVDVQFTKSEVLELFEASKLTSEPVKYPLRVVFFHTYNITNPKSKKTIRLYSLQDVCKELADVLSNAARTSQEKGSADIELTKEQIEELYKASLK